MAKTEQMAKDFTVALAVVVEKWGSVVANGEAHPPELKTALETLRKLGKLTDKRLCGVITGKWMEQNPTWKAGTKPAPILNSVFAVFQDAQRHSCIRIAQSNKTVTFIPMATELLVYELTHYEFERQYTIKLEDYPVKRAAELYLEAKHLLCSDLAKRHLEFICGKSFVDPVVPLNFDNQESIMATKPATKPAAKVDAKAPAVKTTAPAKAPAVKVAAKVDAKATPVAKPAAKVEAPKAAKAAKAAPAKADKAPKADEFAGKSIVVLNKDHGRREGTWSHFMNQTAVTSKTTAEAQAKVDASPEYKGKTMDWKYLLKAKLINLK